MGDRHALALDDVDPERRGVEQHVDEVVVEQVDLVDVEDPAVRLGEQARLERLLALAQRLRDVDRPRDPVLGRVERQVDDPPLPGDDRQARTRGTALPARRTRLRRVAAEGTIGDDVDRGSSSASPRTAVDFAVPLGPRTSSPPTAGLTALTRSARFRRSCPTIAVNG